MGLFCSAVGLVNKQSPLFSFNYEPRGMYNLCLERRHVCLIYIYIYYMCHEYIHIYTYMALLERRHESRYALSESQVRERVRLACRLGSVA